jgi:hypothetical protein
VYAAAPENSPAVSKAGESHSDWQEKLEMRVYLDGLSVSEEVWTWRKLLFEEYQKRSPFVQSLVPGTRGGGACRGWADVGRMALCRSQTRKRSSSTNCALSTMPSTSKVRAGEDKPGAASEVSLEGLPSRSARP